MIGKIETDMEVFVQGSHLSFSFFLPFPFSFPGITAAALQWSPIFSPPRLVFVLVDLSGQEGTNHFYGQKPLQIL